MLGSFRFFKKIIRDIPSQGTPLVSTTPALNFPTGTAGVVDTGGKQ
jgi:hypothetical protein